MTGSLPSTVSGDEEFMVSRTVPNQTQTEIPRAIGRYEIHQWLGRGGFGEVYRAFDPVLRRQVALKIPRSDAMTPIHFAHFLREARAAARLRHPNLVSVLEFGEIDGLVFIATEYVRGQPLSKLIEAGTVSQQTAVRWVRDLSMGLAHAHANNVIHRDIKPSNVLIDVKRRPHLTDFGLAKRVHEDTSLTVDGDIKGTPAYMSPEQIRGAKAEIGPATDQYSLAAVLFELLTGHRPYEGPLFDLLVRIQHEPVPPLTSFVPSISPYLDAVCRRAMAKRTSDRFSNMKDFAVALHQDLRQPKKRSAQESLASKAPAAPQEKVADTKAAATPIELDEQRSVWTSLANALPWILIGVLGGIMLSLVVVIIMGDW